MPHKTADFVEQLHTGFTGSGEYTDASASVPSTMRSIASQLATGDTAYFVAQGETAGGDATEGREVFLGTKTATGLARTTLIASTTGGFITWATAAAVRLSLVGPASKLVQLDNVGSILLPAASAEPATPAAGFLNLYAREIVPGWVALKNMRPSGVDSPLQDALIFNRLQRWVPSNNTNIGIGAGILTFAGTATAVTISSGSAKSNAVRTQWASAATAGALTTVIQAANLNGGIYRGGVAGEGGFRVAIRIALNQLQSGNRGFWGRAASNTAATNIDPTTTAAPARVGIGFNANTGNWQLIRSDGTNITVVDLGANFPLNTSDMIELALFARPHNGTSAGDITYRVRRYTTSSASPANETTGTLTTNIPAATTLLYPWHFMTNNATAAAVSYHWCGEGQESDW